MVMELGVVTSVYNVPKARDCIFNTPCPLNIRFANPEIFSRFQKLPGASPAWNNIGKYILRVNRNIYFSLKLIAQTDQTSRFLCRL